MLLARKIRVPNFFLIDKNLIKGIDEILKKQNLGSDNIIVVSGNGKTKCIADRVAESIKAKSQRFIVNGNDVSSVSKLECIINKSKSSLVIGVGGGKVLDITKFASYETSKPFLAVPTTLSNDGLSSPIAVLRDPKGNKSMGVHPPVGIIVDIEVIKTAPLHALLAGAGDLISNISALEDWKLSNRITGESFDKFSEILAKNSVERFMNYILQNNYNFSINDQTIIRLAEGLIQSGMAMSLAGTSRPCSGAEHLISHALDVTLESPKPHGLQVGLATLFTMSLRKSDVSEMVAVFKKIDFPLIPRLLSISKDEFMKAVRIAPSTRKRRFTILDLVSSQDCEEAWKIAYNSEN